MNVKTIYLAGVPASGKTTIFRNIRRELFEGCTEGRSGLCRYIVKDRYYMIGVFDGTTFEGTDKLSMAAIDDCIEFILGLEASDDKSVVFVEGDRLFNERFFRQTDAMGLVVYADKSVLRMRHHSRDNQSETFLKGRETKVARMAGKFSLPLVLNNTTTDCHNITNNIIRIAKRWIGSISGESSTGITKRT